MTRRAAASANKARVVHLLPHARSLGGTERTVLDLITSPELGEYEQRVAFVRPGAVRGFAPPVVLPRRAIGGPLPAILRFRPDIVHGWLLQGNVLGAVVKLRRPAVRLVTSERNVGHALTAPKRPLERLVARMEDAATANSRTVRSAAVARVPRRDARFRVISPGVPPIGRPASVVAGDAVMVGRLHPVKDHETALRAWAHVVRRRPDARLSIVGDGPERPALERLAVSLGLDGRVTFYGEADPAPHLHGARVFLLSSRAEGFARALVEALVIGLPAVCTDVGGVSELPEAAVRPVPVGDPGAMAAAVLALLDDDAARERAAAACRAAAPAFSPSRCHSAYAALYRELLA